MASKSNSNSNSPSIPTPPSPQNEYYYENGNLRSQRVYDPSKSGYINTSFSTPQEQGIENQATDYIGKLVNDIPNAVNLSPEAIAGYGEAYAAPQISALNDSYNKAKGTAQMAATGRGVQNSVGFADYGANQIEKNRAQGLADIAANRKLMELDLPNKLLMPYANQFNLYNAALNGQQANMQQNFEGSGTNTGNNVALQNYQNQLAYYNAQNQQNQQNQGRGGLFSFFTGGV